MPKVWILSTVIIEVRWIGLAAPNPVMASQHIYPVPVILKVNGDAPRIQGV